MRGHLAFVLFALLGGACGSHIRREVVGGGAASMQLRGQPGGAPQTIQLARGSYDLALRFDVPRAQIVEYAVTCAGMPIARGQVGMTFEQYRERRLAEMRAKTQRDRQALASVVGAVAPSVQAQATTPNAQVNAQAQVDGNAVAHAAIQDITELAPGDVGAARYQARVQVAMASDATCEVIGIADDPNVIAGYELIRIRDLDAEARERRIAAEANARAVRGQLSASLQIMGADPHALQRRREAEAHARAQAEAERLRVQAELRAKADAERAQRRAQEDARRAEEDARRAQLRAEEDARRAKLQAEADARRSREEAIRAQARADAEAARLRVTADLKLKLELRTQAALQTRSYLIAYLAGECHADPHKRERERAAELRIREERELKIRLELEARAEAEARLRAERDARRAERDAHEARLRAEREARDAKLRAEREARLQFEADQRRAREFKLQQEREARIAIELEARRRREAEENRRIELALNVRGELQTYLVSLGARKRPPMPALLVENPGPSPFQGAEWIAGYWTWTGGQWMWTAGGWRDTSTFGAAGSSGGVAVGVGIPVSVPVNVNVDVNVGGQITHDPTIRTQPDVPVQPATVRDHRTNHEPVVRDHRTGGSTPNVRDHRTGSGSASGSGGTVRDHRTSDTKVEPTVRDHRTKSDAKTEPNVRDHRKR